MRKLFTLMMMAVVGFAAWASGSDDFSTVAANTQYGTRTSTAGWVGTNCAVVAGDGTNGITDGVTAFVMNGKTSTVGTITSPTLTGGLSEISFGYGYPFAETSGVSFKVEVIQSGSVVKTITITDSSKEAKTEYSYSEDGMTITGDFTLKFTNLCPSNATKNKDRLGIYSVSWVGYTSGGDTPVVETVATPEIEADGGDGQNSAGEWIDEADVEITCTTSGATIYYTLDGSDPTDQSTEYNAPFTVNTTCTVKAIAMKSDMNNSAIASLLVKIGEADPVTPTGYTDDEITRTTLDFGSETSGYKDFTTAALSSGAEYAGNAYASNSTQIQLRSSGSVEGLVSTVSGGKIKKVTVSWGSTTTNGRTLNVYGSNTAYTDASDLYDSAKQGTLLGTIVMGTSTKLDITGDYAYVGVRSNASAMYLDGITFSWETSGTPVVETVATPVIEADGGDGQNSQGEWIDEADVTITCTTSGATIYYTLDGSDPTDQSSEYLAPFTVNTTCTVKAIAMKSDMNNSAIASLLVKIGEADPVTPTGYTDDEITRSTLDFGSVTSGYADFTTAALSSGAEYAGNAYASNSAQIQLRSSGSVEGLVSTVSGGNIRKVKLTWGSGTNAARIIQVYGSNSAYTDASDLYAAATQGTLLGELGTTDTELSVTNDYAYVGIRSKSSALYLDGVTFTWEAAEAPAVAAPVITVQDESVIGDQTVEITCATNGAVIYYTTDGGDPTASDDLYNGPFTVSADCTVKAVAYDGTNYSAITAKVITINVAISVEDAYALDATDTSLKNKEYTIAFEDAKVIYVGTKNSNKYTYVREGDESILLYNDGLNLPLNAIINGYATFKFNPFNGLPEFAAVSAAITNTDHLTITESSEAAQPIPATVDDIANGLYLNNLVALKNVPVVENEGKYYASNDEGATLLFQIYDQFGTGALENFTSSGSNGIRRKATPVGGNDGFDITGMVGKYYTTLQIQPTSSSSIVTGVEEIAAEKNVESVRYFNLLGVESNEPFAGMNVVVTTYTDGTKAARKVVK